MPLDQPKDGDDSTELGKADPKTFEFVTITRPSDATNTEISKTVRTQAMRDWLRKQNRQAITGVVEAIINVRPEEPARYKGRFKLNTWSHKTKTKAINARLEKGLPISIKKGANRKGPNVSLKVSPPKQHQSLNPVYFLDGSRLDPFDSLSIKLGSRSEALLLHCEFNALTRSFCHLLDALTPT